MSVVLAILDAGLFPRVEDPIPESVGFDVPFTVAGWGAIYGLARGGRTAEEREERIRFWTLSGLRGGSAFLLLAVAAELP